MAKKLIPIYYTNITQTKYIRKKSISSALIAWFPYTCMDNTLIIDLDLYLMAQQHFERKPKCHFTIVWNNKEFNSFRDATNDEHGCKGYFVKKSRKEIIL